MDSYADIENIVDEMKKRFVEESKKRDRLKNLDLIVFDNSIRESTVGQLRGHTLKNKWKIYDEVWHHMYVVLMYTGCAKLIFTLFYKIAAIFAILTLQRRVIRRWNGNFVGFMEIFSKIVKNVPVKQYLHFSGKWQK